VVFTASVTANAPITYHWQKRPSGGSFANLTDGGNILGSGTDTLTVSNVGDSDEASYRLVASDAVGTVNSVAVQLIVLSPLSDVTAPSDSIVGVNGNGNTPNEGVTHAIDNDYQKYLNFNLNSG